MKTLKRLSFLLLSGLLLISCGEKPTIHPDGEGGNPPIIVEAPKNIIPVKQADNWYKNYGSDRAPIIEKAINADYPSLEEPYKTSRFVTADYQTLKEYIAFIDQESKKAGVKPSGLRFYFAATNSSVKGPGRETVFMNPVTAFKGINGDISYAIATDVEGNKTAVTVGSVIDRKTPNGTNLILQEKIQSLSGDELQWPPPPYPNDPNDFH